MSKNWNENIETFAKHIQIYKTLALRWQINPSFLHRNLKYVHIARTSSHPNRSNSNRSIEEIFKSRLNEISHKSTSSSLLRGEAFNLHLRGWSYDPNCLQDRRGVKYNVAFDLSASCLEKLFNQTSNVSRTMKLGRIDSISPNELSSSMNDDELDESSTISFHVSTKYVYTLTFSSTITASRGDGNKISMSFGKRVQLDSLFDPRQPMSTVQSIELLLTPVLIDGQEISKTISSQFPATFTICFDLTREAVEMVRSGASTRKRQPISPSKIPVSHQKEQQYQDPNAKRMRTTQKTNKTPNNSLSLWRDNSANNEHSSSINLPLYYSFVTDNKQCLASSYMSSKGHCCLCQFTAINNDLDVLIKHLSYCHPRFTASIKKNSDRPNIELRLNAFYDGSLDTFDMFAEYYPRKRRITSELILWRPPRYRRLAMDDAPFVCRRAALTRVYRHTTGAQPIQPEHIQIDSDDEIYPEWTQQLSRRMMEDFQDVNEGEKEMMIMWNHHVMKYNFIADSQMPYACELFVEKHAKDLREKNLIKNFYLHLATLQLYNLIKKTDLAKCIIRLKAILASTPSVSTCT
ncbi:unnamed protein product [Adineta ricciae]|uniref:Polycomb protein VEFS-Box domain-containing protein n=1 Tax=Adineta ricciae TaxID=249248 RepID=A0A814WH76_ADIRI|nr:unnamed protein product [Adineta ricciae]CAF1452906.1 unnamed protein product [Adineta ricciae]